MLICKLCLFLALCSWKWKETQMSNNLSFPVLQFEGRDPIIVGYN